VKNSKIDIFGMGSGSGSHKDPAPPIKMRQLRCWSMGLHDINQFSNRFYLNRSILTYTGICKIWKNYSIMYTAYCWE
jgi:hypothetical protein